MGPDFPPTVESAPAAPAGDAQFIADLRHRHMAYDMWELGNLERSW
jgi:hypothetical protein